MDTFGKRIEHLRSQKGMSQRELGDRLETSGATISHWETGKTHPDRIRRSLIESAASKLDTTVEYLLKGHGTPFRVRSVGANRLPGWDFAAAATFVYSSPHRRTAPDEEQRFVLTEKKYSTGAYFLEVTDQSMAPDLPVGSVVIVEPDRQPVPNCVVAIGYLENDEARVTLRYFHDRGPGEGGTRVYEAAPLQRAYRTISSSDTSLKVLGVVVERRLYEEHFGRNQLNVD